MTLVSAVERIKEWAPTGPALPVIMANATVEMHFEMRLKTTSIRPHEGHFPFRS